MIELGWEPIPLKARQKTPLGPWAQPATYGANEVTANFHEAVNVGVALGGRSGGLVDLDFDWTEAAAVGHIVFPGMPSYGRASAPGSHRLVKCSLSKGRHIFQLPHSFSAARGIERGMILEIRGNGHQSMVPPSVHPSGESVSWHLPVDSLPEVEEAELKRMSGLCAFLAVVLRFYPRVSGDRDNICLALTGALVRAGLAVGEVDQLVQAIAQLAGDEEAIKRGGKAASAAEALSAGSHVWGVPELCKRLDIDEVEPTLRGWIGGAVAATEAKTVREIVVAPGRVHEMLDEAEAALIEGGAEIYQRNKNLVRIIRLGGESLQDGVVRRTGSLTLQVVTVFWLREQLSRVANWVRLKDGTRVAVDPPHDIGKTYMERVGEWRVPELLGVVQCPTLRSDGTILQEPGYDAQSKLYYDPGTAAFPRVPEAPSRGDAESALAMLREPFREFPFAEGELSLSVALSAVLTALVRGTLATAPLFAIDAPTPGSGKSKIAEMVGLIATGSLPTMMSQGRSAEEDEKRLSSSLMVADPVIVIDNCELQVEGDFLCSALSQEIVAARVLGRSERQLLPTKSLIMATGNNLTLAGDVVRRAVVCRLDAGIERPEQVNHSFDPIEEVRAKRAELVVAGLTILRAYMVAGRPVRLSRAMGSFEAWDIIRGALVWLGLPDPVTSQDRLAAVDPKRAELSELLAILLRAKGGQSFRAADLDTDDGRIRDDLIALLGMPRFSAKSIGRRLAGYVDRPINGKALRSSVSSGTRVFWVGDADAETTAEPSVHF
ncbi:MAG TPA: bifunctional DNA primase/polymerase [Devosia sp.]|nr:bifunctional DNA primase/polymerase [Devosia sp.]